jgi:hypothetical protein
MDSRIALLERVSLDPALQVRQLAAIGHRYSVAAEGHFLPIELHADFAEILFGRLETEGGYFRAMSMHELCAGYLSYIISEITRTGFLRLAELYAEV